MPEILPTHSTPIPPVSDLDALILRAECVAKDLIMTLPAISLEAPQRTALYAAGEAVVLAFQTARCCCSNSPFAPLVHKATSSALCPFTDGYGEINGD